MTNPRKSESFLLLYHAVKAICIHIFAAYMERIAIFSFLSAKIAKTAIHFSWITL